MQVNETLTEGLKRELKVTIPASELDERLADRLDQLKSRVRIKGFRPGKVPVAHLRRVYGKAAMAEIVEILVGETTAKTIADRGERAAMQPKIALTGGRGGGQRGSRRPCRPHLHARLRGAADSSILAISKA